MSIQPTSLVDKAIIDTLRSEHATASKNSLEIGVIVTLGMNGGAPKTETVTLVIPAKNEAGNIAWVLEQIPACADEIIIVDGIRRTLPR